jgi:hypothetical protein
VSLVRTLVVAATALFSGLTVSAPLQASSGAACGSSGYTYAGVFGSQRSSGIGATLTALDAPQVLEGHVAAWVGVGGPGQGPNGSDEWIQVGLSAFPGTGKSSLYYEIARPGTTPAYHELETGITAGATRRVLVAEVKGRPGVWRIWVNGRPAIDPIFLPASHRAWVPVATAESWGGGAAAVCNSYRYQFDRVRVVHEAGAGWRKLASGTSFQDPGYRVRVQAAGSFLAGRSDDASIQPSRQTFAVSG